jgi:hypothetical protein
VILDRERISLLPTVGAPRGRAFAGADARRHDALDRAVAVEPTHL